MKINLIGNVLGNTGYAIHSRNTLFALDKICDVALETGATDSNEFNNFREKKYMEENTLMITFPDWWRIKFPEDIPVLAGFLVFEGDKIPLNWVRNCKDKRLDLIFTPSKHTQDAAINSGVDKNKIRVIRHGVNCDVFKPEGTKIWDDDIFRFLFVGGWKDGVLDRKGLDIALRAFKEEFRDVGEDSVRFIGKINMAYGGKIKENLELLNLSQDFPNINVILNDLNEKELAELYRSADAFVMPTKAESFCMPVAESLACGTPVIATDYGGHTEYCKKYGCLVKSDWIPATGGQYYEGVRWKRIDFNGLKKAMRKAYEDKDGFKKLGKNGSKFIRKSLTWEKTAEKIVNEFVKAESLKA